MSTEEKVTIRLGARTPWRDRLLAVKGFSGEPEASYAKIIVAKEGESSTHKIGLHETIEVEKGLAVRVDEVPPPSAGPGARPGGGEVTVTVFDGGGDE